MYVCINDATNYVYPQSPEPSDDDPFHPAPAEFQLQLISQDSWLRKLGTTWRPGKAGTLGWLAGWLSVCLSVCARV